jgi:acyl-coenzyme A synthetase/AMP-(fatty) acid ligase
MAHYYDAQLKRPTSFNFASDVVDYWASKPPPGNTAMHWISQDRKQERKLSFGHFSRQSHRLAVLFREKLGVKKGEKMLIIMPRLPEW